MKKRKPTRRDLLIVIGRLQDIIGHASSRFNDRNPNRQDDVDKAHDRGLRLCVEARSYDPPIHPVTGPWAPKEGQL